MQASEADSPRRVAEELRDVGGRREGEMHGEKCHRECGVIDNERDKRYDGRVRGRDSAAQRVASQHNDGHGVEYAEDESDGRGYAVVSDVDDVFGGEDGFIDKGFVHPDNKEIFQRDVRYILCAAGGKIFRDECLVRCVQEDNRCDVQDPGFFSQLLMPRCMEGYDMLNI